MASTMRRRSTVTGRPIEPGVQYGATRSAMRSHSSSLMSPCVVRQVCATPTGSASMTKATRPRTPDGGYPVIDKRGLLEQSLRSPLGPGELPSHELPLGWAEQRSSEEVTGVLHLSDLLVENVEALSSDGLPFVDGGRPQDPVDLIQSQSGVLQHPDEYESAECLGAVGA